MGMRNGVVDRWDTRQRGSKTDLIVNMAERPSSWKMAPSIDYLRVVREHQLLIRTMRGEVRVPVCTFRSRAQHQDGAS